MRGEQADALARCMASIDEGLRQITAHMRQRRERCTLAVETWVIPANGVLTRDWATPYASVTVANQGAQPMTVVSGTPGDVAPVNGPGAAVVMAGKAAAWNLAGYTLTIYGTAGDRVTLSVSTAEQPPAFG